jgi:hypothetical protein
MTVARVKSGWERPPVVCKIFDLIADIQARLDAVESETARRNAAQKASDDFRNAAKE